MNNKEEDEEEEKDLALSFHEEKKASQVVDDVYDKLAEDLEENKRKMRETLGFSLDEFNLQETLKPSANFVEEMMHLIDTTLEPFERDHYFSKTALNEANPYFDDSGSHSEATMTNDEKETKKSSSQSSLASSLCSSPRTRAKKSQKIMVQEKKEYIHIIFVYNILLLF